MFELDHVIDYFKVRNNNVQCHIRYKIKSNLYVLDTKLAPFITKAILIC